MEIVLPKNKVGLEQDNKILYSDITDITDYIEETFGIEKADHFQHEMREQLKCLEMVGSGFGRTNIGSIYIFG